jgi:hypothetical protein
MQYAVDGNSSRVTDCTISVKNESIKFASGKTYKEIGVVVNEDNDAKVYDYLLTQKTEINPISSTAVTNGYCSLESFTPRVKETNATDYNADTFHVCPVNEDGDAKEITTGSVIADALNNGVDSIGVAADDNMKENIDQFKADVLDASGKEADEEITEEDIVNYLNKNNKE